MFGFEQNIKSNKPANFVHNKQSFIKMRPIDNFCMMNRNYFKQFEKNKN